MELEHGYFTLFGDKPVTLAGDYTVTPYSNILYAHENSGGIFWKNWEIWQKYQANFLLNDYLFIEEPSPKIQSLTNLIFINKKALMY